MSNVSNNLSQGGWERAANLLSPEEQIKKFNISSKLFKLRYLCKYHLQLCAVLSQLLRNKEALQHGMMASFYCQELIRNTHLLCQGYISKLQEEKKKEGGREEEKEEEINLNGKQPTYYVEENEKFLNLLISNCEPILNEIVSKFDSFNRINKIESAFDQHANVSYSDEDESDDLLESVAAEFSIKADVAIKKKTTANKLKKPALKDSQPFSYKSLKNNYLYKPTPSNPDELRRHPRDEATPEAVMERRKSMSELSAYYNTQEKKSTIKLQDNVKTILGVKDQDDWIFNLNIGNVMHLLPMSLEELNLHLDNSHELSRDAMLEKIILLSVSYFCVGTELRFLSKQTGKAGKQIVEDPDDGPENRKYLLEDSEMWHAMALETCGTFLPSECPLVSHMIISFQKHHSPSMASIPEDETLNEQLSVLRPLNEVKMDQINYH